jgi:ssDNA-binding Zn-finger/Zn-ribbon topoisomerase 1
MSTTAIPPRPQTMPLNPSGLPDDPIMREARCVVWGWTWNPTKEKWDKPPARPVDGRAASVTNKADWTDLAAAIAAVKRYRLAGIGVVLEQGCGVVGIDLDKCRDPLTAAIEPWAQAIIDRFRSYWEPSASGTGIRIFIRAQLPPGRRRTGQIEMYDDGRYLTINGNPGPGASRHFAERQAELDDWHAALFPAPTPQPPPVHRGHPPVSADDRAVLDHARAAKNGAKFARLYDAGDTSGHTSHSEARQAICSLLAFWCEHDQDQCARLFQGSALCREDKWPRERERVLALAYSRGDFYRWPARQERVPLSTLDTPPVAGALAEYLAMPHDTLAQLAADQAAAIAERDRRLDALDELLTSKDMLPVDRIVAYGVVKAGAVAQRQQTGDEPTRDLVVNQKAIACAINVSRQTVGGKLRQWGDQGHLGKATRPTGQRAKAGDELLETVIQLPARSLTDNIMCAATWTRPPDAPHVGGNGNRCPKCNGATTKKAIETKTIETTTLSCADCGHVHTQTQRTIGRPTTTYSFSDDTTPPVLDLAAIRGTRGVASVDTPPVAESTPKDCDTGVHPATPPRGVAVPDRPEPPPLDPAIAGNLAGCHDAADIAARLARLRERWAVGDRTPTVCAAISDWEAIAAARAALDAHEMAYAVGDD